jgi:hypothetical protein
MLRAGYVSGPLAIGRKAERREPMSNLVNPRLRALRSVSAPTHKYAVGASVIHRIGFQSQQALFHVVRQMPDGGFGLQYRLKSVTDGHERVVLETSLEKPAPEPFSKETGSR